MTRFSLDCPKDWQTDKHPGKQSRDWVKSSLFKSVRESKFPEKSEKKVVDYTYLEMESAGPKLAQEARDLLKRQETPSPVVTGKWT